MSRFSDGDMPIMLRRAACCDAMIITPITLYLRRDDYADATRVYVTVYQQQHVICHIVFARAVYY